MVFSKPFRSNALQIFFAFISRVQEGIRSGSGGAKEGRDNRFRCWQLRAMARKIVALRVVAGLMAAVVFGGVAVLQTGCKPEEAQVPAELQRVTVAQVQEREIRDYLVFTGRTEAAETVEVRARVSGYLMETRFKDGQDVKRGDVLFVIDPRPYQADFDRAKAEYDRSYADLQLATVEFGRSTELRNKGTISAADFDTKSAAYLKAQSALASAKAAWDTAKLNLEFTTIFSPIDGMISKAAVTPGNLVTPDMKEPLTVIVSTNPVYAYADIDERQLLRYIRLNNEESAKEKGVPDPNGAEERRTTIQLQLADETGFPHEGNIDFADNRVRADTGTLTIRGVFDDKEEVLAPGLFVRLRLPAGKPYAALLVPQESIGIDQGQKFIYTVSGDGTVAYRRVQVGSLQDDGWRVVQGDLKAGEKVIVEGMIKVRPGMKVESVGWQPKSGVAQPGEARP